MKNVFEGANSKTRPTLDTTTVLEINAKIPC